MHVIQASCPLPFCTYIDKNDSTDMEICIWFLKPSITYFSHHNREFHRNQNNRNIQNQRNSTKQYQIPKFDSSLWFRLIFPNNYLFLILFIFRVIQSEYNTYHNRHHEKNRIIKKNHIYRQYKERKNKYCFYGTY